MRSGGWSPGFERHGPDASQELRLLDAPYLGLRREARATHTFQTDEVRAYRPGCDPLHDEGEAYGKRLHEAGVEVDVRSYPGVFHGFFGFRGILPEADAAADAAFAALAKALQPGVYDATPM